MEIRYLSKSDFMAADDCITKLYFRKNRFPDGSKTAYSDYLARIGHLVGHIAQLTYGPGEVVDYALGAETAADQTMDWIKRTKKGVLFEATFLFEQRLVRVDVLKKQGSRIELIEVKSSGFDSLEWNNGPKAKKKMVASFSDNIMDLAFQTSVLERALPGYDIEPYLCFIDKNAINGIEGLYGNFKVYEENGRQGGYCRVNYTGDVEELKAQFLLFPEVGFKAEVDAQKDDVWARSQAMIEKMANSDDFDTFRSPRKMACASCGFKKDSKTEERNGFALCWEEDAFVEPHILSIRRDASMSIALNPLVASGLAKISDVPKELLISPKGPKQYGIPLQQAAGIHEYIGPELKKQLAKATYPMYFIDFETIRPAIPFHEGMTPYSSVVLFQWSCHKISHEGAPVEHFEYLNTESGIPNGRFIAALRDVLGDTGTIFTWSSFENAQLKNYLLNQLESDALTDMDLVEWLTSVLKEGDGGWRQIDLHNDVVQKYYYHESMGSRTSIKAVLPAILSEPQPEMNAVLLQSVGLYQKSESGEVIDPYKLLAGVSDGTQAMMAYEALHFGQGAENESARKRLIQELLAYCRLDTLSMVIIYAYLTSKKVGFPS
jgi:hypothetical protein